MSTAVFGGTFDPVHTGHVKMAQSAIQQFELCRLVIVPNGNPPHKADITVTDFDHRYNMLKLAFEGMDKVEISDYESREDKFSYSLYTMRYFREVYGEDTYFIIGADSLLSIHLWHEYRTLLKENRFIVFPREGGDELEAVARKYRAMGSEIYFSHMPMIDVSSTQIRSKLSCGSDCEGILCPRVREYINKNSIYGGAL